MRFDGYVNEAYTNYDNKPGRSKVISVEHAKSILKNYTQAIKSPTVIYRGNTYNDEPLYLLDPTTFLDRVSPFANHNYYNMLLSNLPSWSKYPKRNKSVICTTSYSNASGRQDGNPYVVLPQNGAKIGVCSERDIWFSFKKFQSMNAFNRGIEEIVTPVARMGGVDFGDADTSYKMFIRLCNKLDLHRYKIDVEAVKDSSYDSDWDWLDDYIDKEYKTNEKFITILDKILNPSQNDFKLVKVGTRMEPNVEVWTDAPCLLVRTGTDFIQELELNFGSDYDEREEE
jgi:hypothetical protein